VVILSFLSGGGWSWFRGIASSSGSLDGWDFLNFQVIGQVSQCLCVGVPLAIFLPVQYLNERPTINQMLA
jgi:hypothetical protein